jgi:putative hydrolase
VAGAEGFNPQNLAQMLQDLGSLLATPANEPINWTGAVQVAQRALAKSESQPLTPADSARAETAVTTAELWLSEATTLPAHSAGVDVWTASDWVEGTIDEWRELVNPIAARAGETLTEVLPRIAELTGDEPDSDREKMSQTFAPLASMMKPLSAAMFGMQVGNGLASVASEVLCSSDIGVPLTQDHTPALVLPAIDKFGSQLGEAGADALIFISLREAAHQRLFAAAPWLASQFKTSIVEYSRTIGVDMNRLRDIVGSVEMSSPTDVQSMQEILGNGLMDEMKPKQDTPALNRLETMLALVEGWVEQVVSQATQGRLPSAAALSETVRRRRAAGGPAEKTFMTLMGLQLKAARLRQANEYWSLVFEKNGAEHRDTRWAHPDLLPNTQDLADPNNYIQSQ